MRVAGQLWFLLNLKAVKQLAGTIQAIWQSHLYHGFLLEDLYPRAVASLPSGFALGKTYNHPRYKYHTPTQAGFYLLGGGEIPTQNFFQLNLTKAYNVLTQNLSAISQLLGPQNCLRMLQNHSQKTQNSKHFWGACPQTPLENCSLWLQPPSTITFKIFPPPKLKILDRTGLTIH